MLNNGKNAPKIDEVTDEQWATICEFNRKITEEFLEESVNLSPKTLIQYKSCLRQFFWWVKVNCDDKSIIDIKSRDYLKYQNFMIRRGLSPANIRLKRAAVSSLNGYILMCYEDEYPLFKNFITKKITNPAPEFVREKKPLTTEEFNNLIKVLEERKEWQKVAYLLFTYSAGCRKTESMQILKEVVNTPLVVKEKTIKADDDTEKVIQIKYYNTHDVRCKGRGMAGKVRKLQFDERAMEALKKWLEVRGEDDCPYMFVTKYKGEIKQVSDSTFQNWCKGEFTEIVGRRVHPHLLRESRATNMVVAEGKDIKAAQKLLGHKSSETTEIYVIREDDDDLDEAFI